MILSSDIESYLTKTKGYIKLDPMDTWDVESFCDSS